MNARIRLLAGLTKSKLLLVTLLLLLVSPTNLSAAVVTVNPSADVELSEQQASFPNPSAVTIVAGTQGSSAGGPRNRGLLQFDLSGQVPAGSSINSVVLSLNVTRAPAAGVNSNFELYRALTPWSEAAATWNAPSATASWGAPGGLSGTDWVPLTSGSVPVSGVGTYTFTSNSRLVSDVEAWLANPEANFGWFLMSAGETSLFTARHFASSESLTPPVLTIEFTPVPEPATCMLLATAGLAVLLAKTRRKKAPAAHTITNCDQ